LLEELGTVVKSKCFATKPITASEAMMRMELLGHGFSSSPTWTPATTTRYAAGATATTN